MSGFRKCRASRHRVPEKLPPLPSLIFLLTGDADVAVDALTDGADVNDPEAPFFDRWITSWERSLVIAKALQSVHSEIVSSIARFTGTPDKNLAKAGSLPPPPWSAAQEVTGAQLQPALLAIEIFPRCVLLLTLFEGMLLDDVAALLRTDKKLVQRAEVNALIELARNIALEQGWSPPETAGRANAAPAAGLCPVHALRPSGRRLNERRG